MAQIEPRSAHHQPELERLGFSHGNPFATMEADQERAFLDDLFVDIDNFERIRAAGTVIVYAPRGCGKSAVRVRLTNSLAPWTDRPDVDTFAVELLHFDGILSRLTAGEKNTIDPYIDAILHTGAQSIFSFLFTAGSPNARYKRLSVTGQVQLGRLLWRFAPDLLLPEKIYELLKKLISDDVDLSWPEFRRALHERRVSDFLGARALERSSQAAGLAFLLDLEPEDRQWPPSNPHERLTLVMDVVKSLGFQCLAVMVDRVDEIRATAADTQVQSDLLEPLLANLPLMEMPGIQYKFFIPTGTRDALLKRRTIRADRLDFVEATVDWSESRLQKLLARRLKFFSGLPDFSTNTSTRREDGPDGEESLSEAIEREMVALAAHSPRRLIRAGQLLLNAYLNRPNADSLIWADWLAARNEMMRDDAAAEFSEEEEAGTGQPTPEAEPSAGKSQTEGISPQGMPYLLISTKRPLMRLKGREISLSETEVKIIRTLLARNGTVEEEVLVDEVWNKAISTAGIDVALKRIRDEVDRILGVKKSGLKYYLLKKSGTVMLINYKIADEEPS